MLSTKAFPLRGRGTAQAVDEVEVGVRIGAVY